MATAKADKETVDAALSRAGGEAVRVYAARSPRLAQRLIGQTDKACRDFSLIREGDRLLLGLSGGKDSVALLWTLASLKAFYPYSFDLAALTIASGFPSASADTPDKAFSPMANLCRELNVPYHVAPFPLGQAAIAAAKDGVCSLCARLRRAALSAEAKAQGRSVLVLAHHRDDAIETFLMSILFEGRISCFSPSTYYEDSKIRVIRPFVYVNDAESAGFVRKAALPIIQSDCPLASQNGRARIRALIHELRKDKKDIKATLFSCLKKAGLNAWNVEGQG